MTSFILGLWTKSIGRDRFAPIFSIIGALVFFLPGTINLGLSVAFKGAGPDPAFAIARGLLFGWLASFGLLALFTPLVFATRMRLRDLGLSGTLIILVPLLALSPLSTSVLLHMQPLLLMPVDARSPLTSAAVLVSAALGVALCVTPGQRSGKPFRGDVMNRLREWTDCKGTIDFAEFRRRAGATIALLMFGIFFDWSGLTAALATTVLLSLCVRRLHDLGKTGLIAGLLPLTFSPGMALLSIAMMPLGFVTGPNLLVVFLPLALDMATLVFLVYLFLGDTGEDSSRPSTSANA